MTATYPSGFHWLYIPGASPADRDDPTRHELRSPTGKTAATVYEYRNSLGGHNWFVWDEDGVGGENSSEPTIEVAKITAESAVLRWGRHFVANMGKED